IVGRTSSERLDYVLTHRLLGLPILLFMMWCIFQLTANVSAPMVDWLDGVINGVFSRWVGSLLGAAGLGGTWVESLLVGGVLTGIGGVLVFVPVLMGLYFAIGVLEDSGYMARAAFVMDRAMRVVGLHGKSFLPMLVGFGCNVPAVYATRTLEHEVDRKVTGFLVTFMSCGARLPVYVVVGSAIFGAQAGNLIFAMYILGIVVALATAFLLKRVIYRHLPPQPFVMELPPYRAPHLRDIWRQMSNRTGSFIREAGTIILTTSVVIWVLLALPVDGHSGFNDVAPEQSAYGAVSRAIAPVFAPAGFDSWQASGALVSGLVAKEVVVSTMSQIMVGESVQENAEPSDATSVLEDVRDIGVWLVDAVVLTAQETINIVPRTLNLVPSLHVPEVTLIDTGGEDDTTALEAALARLLTPLSALAFTAFVLLYTPCMTTVAAMRHEFGGRWTLYQIIYTLVVAWAVAVLIFQVGRLLGYGG
ncbi:MAG: ferrous iron transport protein B, partial [Anaerolineae bacterium]|nr:ferrous iron transport protein B [Anaerolineae bacterium]